MWSMRKNILQIQSKKHHENKSTCQCMKWEEDPRTSDVHREIK